MSDNKTKNEIPNNYKIEDGLLWLKTYWPNVRVVDHNWTMERYDYPFFVRQYIKENWITVSEVNGGTYAEPIYYRENQKNLDIVYKSLSNSQSPV